METLQEKEAVKEFQKLLMENCPEMAREYAGMLRQVDSMAGKLDAALKELQEVKNQLAGMQDGRAVRFASRAAALAEGRLKTVRSHLLALRIHIVEGAREAVEDMKHRGVAALDRAAERLGIKESLKAMLRELDSSATAIDKSIKRMETIGGELRSMGGHVKNIARAVSGKEQKAVDGGREGRFQAAVLAPLRMEKVMLARLCNTVHAALGCVERLEHAAGRNREAEKITRQEEAGTGKTSAEKQDGSRGEKPSVIKALQEKKAEAAVRPAPDRERKTREAAL